MMSSVRFSNNRTGTGYEDDARVSRERVLRMNLYARHQLILPMFLIFSVLSRGVAKTINMTNIVWECVIKRRSHISTVGAWKRD